MEGPCRGRKTALTDPATSNPVSAPPVSAAPAGSSIVIAPFATPETVVRPNPVAPRKRGPRAHSETSTWRDAADGGTAVYRPPTLAGSDTATTDDSTNPGAPHPIHDRGSTGAMLLDPGGQATVIGAYLADDEDGRGTYVRDGETIEIGRKPGSPFFDDPFVDRYHAALTPGEDGMHLEDFDSTNGVYVRIAEPVALTDGDHFIIGHQVFAYRELSPRAVPADGAQTRHLGCPDRGHWGRIDAMLGPQVHTTSVPLSGSSAIVGSGQHVDVRVEHDDGVLPSHCRIARTRGRITLEDCDTEHGTFIRIASGTVLPYGSHILFGRTLVRLDRIDCD